MSYFNCREAHSAAMSARGTRRSVNEQRANLPGQTIPARFESICGYAAAASRGPQRPANVRPYLQTLDSHATSACAAAATSGRTAAGAADAHVARPASFFQQRHDYRDLERSSCPSGDSQINPETRSDWAVALRMVPCNPSSPTSASRNVILAAGAAFVV
jgi:hypothetical protein